MSSTEETPGGESFLYRRDRERAVPPELGHVRAGETVGDYRLVEPLGRGGMGQVWVAEQLSLHRRVALKLVLPERVSETTLALFAREARAGGRLSHPGIVAVYEHGDADGLGWIAMELVADAWTLREALDEIVRDGDLPDGYYRHAATFVAELADALEAAHRAGVIHRDLKPANVLITRDDHPKLTDFGLARITDESALSATGDFAGTYYYMSPEQVAAKRIGLDHRTDIFSLGVVLYEMLAQRRPFEGDTAQQVGYQILQKDPPDLMSVRSRIPRDLAVICGKCLEKDRVHRYATMADLAADVRRYLSNEPIVARPPGALRRLQLWALRNPAKSLSGVVAAVALGVISVLLVANVRANRVLEGTVGDLAEQTRIAGDAATAATARANEVLRLSALQDYGELSAKAHVLWPPHPVNIDAYRAWIDDARALVADLPLHHRKREELRETALPLAAVEVEAQRRAHPQYEVLEGVRGVLAYRRAALRQRRDGIEAELPELDWTALPADARALNRLAWPLVDPRREDFGREPEGLALAQRALELVDATQDEELVSTVHDTLAWALSALGRDAEAIEASQTALDFAAEAKRGEFESYLTEMRKRAKAGKSAETIAGQEDMIARLEARLPALEELVLERQEWSFPDTDRGRETKWWHESLSKLIELLEGLVDPRTGLLSAAESSVTPDHGWSIPRRLAFAEQLRDGLAEGGEWHDRWAEAIAAIREHAAYDGLAITAQIGLVPIAPDPASGLWEFWHVATGDEPTRGEDGELVIADETGMVFVLIPGGTFWMGAQATDPNARNFDPSARVDEVPVHEVELSPYFLSKYEMTQGQWSRFTGRNPSLYQWPVRDQRLEHPVEQVTWTDCVRELERLDLSLPSEAQWEYACRAGTDTPWWTGADRESLREKNAVNLADQAGARAGAAWAGIADWPELDDGHGVHAPVGTYSANPFGLHEMHGNVWELCLDAYGRDFYRGSPRTDPVAPAREIVRRVGRGGGFGTAAASARSAYRFTTSASDADSIVGLRPARAITR